MPSAPPAPVALATRIQPLDGKRSALWDVTGTCNLRCKHCYQYDLYEYEKRGTFARDLGPDDARLVLTRLVEAGVTAIHFLGGEPLLRPDLLELVAQAKRGGVTVSINTNGLPLTARRLDDLIAAGVDQIMVSLDGATATTNDAIRGEGVFAKAFANLVRAAERARGSDLLVGITFTATRSNAGELGELFELAVRHGIPHIHIVPVLEAGNFVRFIGRLGSDEDYLLARLDEALGRHGAAMRGKVGVRVDLRLWPIEVLNRKHGVLLEPDPVGVRCQGGKQFLLVQADGRLGPCSASLDPKWNRPAVQRGHLGGAPEYAHRLPRIDDAEVLGSFYRFQEDPATFAGLDPCHRCPHFGTRCQPCPLEYPGGKRVVSQCLWAEREGARHRARVLGARLRAAPGYALDGDALERAADGHRVVVGELLAALIEAARALPLAAALEEVFDSPLGDDERDQLVDAVELLVAHGALALEEGSCANGS